MVKIEFETIDGDTFAHIWSDNGVLGNAKEVKERIPAHTFVTLPSKLHRLAPWLVKKCGFRYAAYVMQEHDIVIVLQKE